MFKPSWILRHLEQPTAGEKSMHTHGDSFSRRRGLGLGFMASANGMTRMTRGWHVKRSFTDAKLVKEIWRKLWSMRNLDWARRLWESTALTSRNSGRHRFDSQPFGLSSASSWSKRLYEATSLILESTRQSLPALPSIMYLYNQWIVRWSDINPRKTHPLVLNLETSCTPQHSFHNIWHFFFTCFVFTFLYFESHNCPFLGTISASLRTTIARPTYIINIHEVHDLIPWKNKLH